MLFSFVEQLKYELSSIFLGYPDFVLRRAGHLAPGEIPVFTFHTIDPGNFERQLTYLRDNDYHTLSMDDCVDMLLGNKKPRERSVLLTIDDGRSSFWRFGYPLLKKYNMKATLFVIPGFTTNESVASDNLLTLGDAPESRAQLKALDKNDATLCSWDQLKQMSDSGLIDIESHTLFHREVFIEPEIVDWIGPKTSFIPHYSPITAYLGFNDCGLSIVPEDYYGLPLFKSTPLMSAKPALCLPQHFRETCRKHYQALDETTRNADNWKATLASMLAEANSVSAITYQTTEQLRDTIRQDLSLARQLIQERVNPKAGNHLCLPFTYGAPMVIEIAKEIGIKSCLWGTVPGKKNNHAVDDPMHIVRVKNDFIFRLPGKARQSLLGIYIEKIRRRLRGEPAF